MTGKALYMRSGAYISKSVHIAPTVTLCWELEGDLEGWGEGISHSFLKDTKESGPE